jgi:hypothetical protein
MSLRKFAVSSRRPVFGLALILILAVGVLASGLGIVFQGFETDVSMWFNEGSVQQTVQEPSGTPTVGMPAAFHRRQGTSTLGS